MVAHAPAGVSSICRGYTDTDTGDCMTKAFVQKARVFFGQPVVR